MILEYEGIKPDIHEDSYIAPNAVIRGDVSIGRGSCVLFGAAITAEGGPVTIGEECVIMEHAIVRGTPKDPAILGDAVLVGPQCHLSGYKIESEVFIATGSTIFNGAHIKKHSEVRINGVVHVNTVLEEESMVPIGWIAVGNPAQIFPPGQHNEIWQLQQQMDFPGTVWGVERSVSQGDRIRRYARALQRHRKDRRIAENSDPE
ncbi:MAG: gamma carbonic anhydrase family protein [Balneolaceae bacterium]|nr:gamma carbonic anhydrase family protein [Balneolaceae bacterium]